MAHVHVRVGGTPVALTGLTVGGPWVGGPEGRPGAETSIPYGDTCAATLTPDETPDHQHLSRPTCPTRRLPSRQ